MTLFLDQKKEVNFQSFFFTYTSATHKRNLRFSEMLLLRLPGSCCTPRNYGCLWEWKLTRSQRQGEKENQTLTLPLSLNLTRTLSLTHTHTHTGATESQSTKKTQLLYLNSQKKGVWPTFPGRNKNARNEWQFLLHIARQIICNGWNNIYKCSHENSQWFWGGHH